MCRDYNVQQLLPPVPGLLSAELRCLTATCCAAAGPAAKADAAELAERVDSVWAARMEGPDPLLAGCQREEVRRAMAQGWRAVLVLALLVGAAADQDGCQIENTAAVFWWKLWRLVLGDACQNGKNAAGL
jgi:hypothetical protein